MKKLTAALSAAALGIALPALALAQAGVGQTVLPAQTVVTGTLERAIDTKTAQPTDQFVLDVQPPYPADDQRFNGARIIGHVASDAKATGTRKGMVTLAFDRLILADGTEATISGTLLSSQGQAGGNTTTRAVVGGVVGQIVGNYIGKHIGTDVGGAVGLIGGAVAGASLGTNVTLPQGSTVSLRTTRAAVVTGRRQAAGTPAASGAPSYGTSGDDGPAPTYAQPPVPAPKPSPTI